MTKIPQTGGTFTRDPNTGALTRVVDPTQEAAVEQPPPEPAEQSDPPAAEVPSPKKGK